MGTARERELEKKKKEKEELEEQRRRNRRRRRRRRRKPSWRSRRSSRLCSKDCSNVLSPAHLRTAVRRTRRWLRPVCLHLHHLSLLTCPRSASTPSSTTWSSSSSPESWS